MQISVKDSKFYYSFMNETVHKSATSEICVEANVSTMDSAASSKIE
jgi:hypothetical protein